MNSSFRTTSRIARAALIVGSFSLALISIPVRAETRYSAILDQVLLDQAAANRSAPGAAAAIIGKGGTLRWSGATGLADLETGEPLTTDRRFRIASVTKLYTSAAIFVLIEQGKLKLNGGITAYIAPETAAILRRHNFDSDAILVRHLLAHTSGLPDYAMLGAYQSAVLADPRHVWTRAEQIDFALSRSNATGLPGERFAYSDTGYIILGEIIERAAGKPLDKALHELFALKAHGLRNTRMERPGDAASVGFVHSYLGNFDTAAIDASFDLYGGGGLLSTVDDLALFVRTLYRGGFFKSSATLSSALSVVPTRHEERMPYALMGTPIMAGKKVCWGHTGFWNVFALYCPAEDIAIAVTLNAHANGLSGQALVEALTNAAEVLGNH